MESRRLDHKVEQRGASFASDCKTTDRVAGRIEAPRSTIKRDEEYEIFPLNCTGNNINNIKNIQFFDKKGRIGELFCFKLNENGKYERHSLKEKKYYEIDLKLKNDKIEYYEEKINKIKNSGNILGDFICDEKTLIQKIDNFYYLGCKNDLTIIIFKPKINCDFNLLNDLPDNSEIIIEGIILDNFYIELELLNGLYISVYDSLEIIEPLTLRDRQYLTERNFGSFSRRRNSKTIQINNH